MVLKGMDTEAIDGLAHRIDAKANSVASVGSSAGRFVRGAERLWLGRRADRWLADWLAQEVSIRRTAHFAHDLAQKLRDEAEQQRRASSGAGFGSIGNLAPWHIGPPQMPGGSRFLPPSVPLPLFYLAKMLGEDQDYVRASGVAGMLGAWATLGRNASLTGDYTDFYRRMVANGGVIPDFWRFKKPLNGPFAVGGFGNALDEFKGLGRLSIITTGVSLLGSANDLFDPNADFGARVGALWDGTNTMLKTSKNPVTYLLGVASSSVKLATDTYVKENPDFSASGRQMVWDEVRKNPGVVVDEFGKAAVQVFTKDIWKIF